MRVRGLKQEQFRNALADSAVAPHAGAWIETISTTGLSPTIVVAPHAGAWIETYQPARSE